MRELGMVGVTRVPVEASVLRLEQRQETTTNKRLAIKGSTKVMGRVSASWHICNVNKISKRFLPILLELRNYKMQIENSHHPD